MFNNPGKLIKIVAKTFTIIGMVASVIGAFVVIVEAEDLLIAISILAGGLLSFWMIGLFIYGFGELVDNSEKIGSMGFKLTTQQTSASAAPARPASTQPSAGTTAYNPNHIPAWQRVQEEKKNQE